MVFVVVKGSVLCQHGNDVPVTDLNPEEYTAMIETTDEDFKNDNEYMD